MKPFHTLLLLFVIAIWGINFVFIKLALQEIPPLLLCAARFFVISIPAFLFFKRPAIPFKWVMLYSLLMFVFQFALLFSGIYMGVSAGLSSILLQMQAFFSILFASFLLKEKLHRWQILGSLLSFSGIAVVGMNLGANATLPGLVLVLAAAATWGLGSVIVKKIGKTGSGSLLVWSSLVAWPLHLLFSLCFEKSYPLLLDFHHLSSTSYIAVLFIALGATVFGFGIWNRLLQSYPLTTMAPFTLLVPFFGMLSAAWFLDEPIELWKILAGILVISGLCFSLLGPRLFAKRLPLDP